MQRYFVPVEQFMENTVEITGDDARHITRVMRGKAGDKIFVSDGVSREALVELDLLEQGLVTANIIEHLDMLQEARVKVTVAQSLPKGDKMETVIQKCTEIGAVSFVPFLSQRTIVQYDAKKEEKRLDRWRKIIKEAAEQSHRNIVPTIESPLTWSQLMKSFSEYDAVYFCYEKEHGLQLRDALTSFIPSVEASGTPKVLLIVGPEGGFTEEECLKAEEAGAVSVGLGRRILRCETAGMVALTCILYDFGEMGGV
ncbi:RsmE family RNA methyltransferase [Paenibacillus crassostreae]|uniref:Ribosomal RNA small subunit methyltransferase E n=1 Tax=Paenibacillus crassostreae TaxID=1763538 RepID=A0A167C279_9BACL|nr:RsmE family RNA methyltransferase [Paenibacillus crassostreae]AOZ91738.1 16S rRNA (uracil(1498)-N(3))-methyltransferase [Paenibacillus crassostreae]OAB72689.1 16S rRNA methyltransferase [Paenibacillus crassostreae]